MVLKNDKQLKFHRVALCSTTVETALTELTITLTFQLIEGIHFVNQEQVFPITSVILWSFQRSKGAKCTEDKIRLLVGKQEHNSNGFQILTRIQNTFFDWKTGTYNIILTTDGLAKITFLNKGLGNKKEKIKEDNKDSQTPTFKSLKQAHSNKL